MPSHQINRPHLVEISKVQVETPSIKTLWVSLPEISNTASPGQFLMVWIPQVDEIPLSISDIHPELAICVKNIGIATKAIHSLKEGDRIGIRGPYGHGFSLKGKTPLLVGGGIGMAHFIYLIRKLQKTCTHITLIDGARTKRELLFRQKLENHSFNNLEVIFTTDDGSYGEKGIASTIAARMIREGNYDYIYTCGPEPLMWSIFQEAEKNNIPIEACLERYMKCGIGLCGTCCLDPVGYRVCVEGPVFSTELLRKISDFGKYVRDPGGKKVKI
ncbi:MAG: dihydroorotate dehydrogenase electron transfer subunit [Candidatus Helarchaeota archaeon]